MLQRRTQQVELSKSVSSRITKLKYNMVFCCKEQIVKNNLSFFVLDNTTFAQ